MTPIRPNSRGRTRVSVHRLRQKCRPGYILSPGEGPGHDCQLEDAESDGKCVVMLIPTGSLDFVRLNGEFTVRMVLETKRAAQKLTAVTH